VIVHVCRLYKNCNYQDNKGNDLLRSLESNLGVKMIIRIKILHTPSFLVFDLKTGLLTVLLNFH
jgi:hypothetical protein